MKLTKGLHRQAKKHLRGSSLLILIGAALVIWLLLYRLGSLTGGVSPSEAQASRAAYGWQGLYRQPLYLPLEAIRSLLFWLFHHHGQTVSRLPNALFGALSIVGFVWLIRQWHGLRTAVMAGVLFATSAWVLHVSRLASFDVLYLFGCVGLLATTMWLQRYPERHFAAYASLIVWGLLLYVPGMVWLVLITAAFELRAFGMAWQTLKRWWQQALLVLAGLIWLPLLIIDLLRPGNWRPWIGLPAHFARPALLLKQFGGVFLHLFIRGPQYPDLWLGRVPLLGVFSLIMCLLGIWFYARHWQAGRSRLLALLFAASAILVALGGPVGLSMLVPLMYVGVATGIAYLLHDWLKVFPRNPLARGLGLGLVSLAIVLSSLYNLRAYFVAWPHSPATQATFREHL